MSICMDKLFYMDGENIMEALAIQVVFFCELVENIGSEEIAEKIRPAIVAKTNKTLKHLAKVYNIDLDVCITRINEIFRETMEKQKADLLHHVFGDNTPPVTIGKDKQQPISKETEDISIDIASMIRNQINQDE